MQRNSNTVTTSGYITETLTVVEAELALNSYKARITEWRNNLRSSEYKIFSSYATSAQLHLDHPDCIFSSKDKDAFCMFGITSMGSAGVILGVSIGTGSVIAPPVFAILAGVSFCVGLGLVTYALVTNETNKLDAHQGYIAAEVSELNDELENIKTLEDKLINKHSFEEVSKVDIIPKNLTESAKKDLEKLSKCPKVSKDDLIARIAIYDIETQKDIIESILNEKTQTTVLGRRFWKQEGFFPCNEKSGRLAILSVMLNAINARTALLDAKEESDISAAALDAKEESDISAASGAKENSYDIGMFKKGRVYLPVVREKDDSYTPLTYSG